MTFQSFLAKLVILTACMAVIISAANYFFPYFAAFQNFTWTSLLFFFIITALIFYFGLKAINAKSPYQFVSIINGSVMVKILLCGFFIIGYALLAKPKDVSFIIPFFFFYIVYTIFEISQLLMAEKKARESKLND